MMAINNLQCIRRLHCDICPYGHSCDVFYHAIAIYFLQVSKAQQLTHISEPVYCVAKQSELTQFKAVEVTEKQESDLTAGKLGFVCLNGCLLSTDETDNTVK